MMLVYQGSEGSADLDGQRGSRGCDGEGGSRGSGGQAGRRGLIRVTLHMAGIKSEQCNESVLQNRLLLATAPLRITGGIDLPLPCVMLLRDYRPMFSRIGKPSSLEYV